MNTTPAPTRASVWDHWPRYKRKYGAILTAYLSRRFMTTLMGVLVVLGLLIYVLDVVDLLRAVSGKNLPTTEVMAASLMKLPNILMELLPFVVLIGTLLWLQGLNKRYELVALRAAGLPARRFLQGPAWVVLMLGVLCLGVLNPVSSSLLRKYEAWRYTVFPGDTRGVVTPGGSVWLRQQDNGQDIFVYAAQVDPNGTSFKNATLLVFAPDGSFSTRMDADEMVLQERKWHLEKVFLISNRQTVQYRDTVEVPTGLTPATIRASFNPPETMNTFELYKFVQVLKRNGWPSASHEMALQRQLAQPAMLLAMFLLAVPLTMRFTRGMGMARTLASGVGLGFMFYLLGNLTQTYGMSGRLSVVMAAWAPALVAMLVAVAMLLYLKEE